MLLVCENQPNTKECLICNSKWHCIDCYKWHIESKECNKTIVENELGRDIK